MAKRADPASTYKVTDEDLAALQVFAADYGRCWKSQLLTYWYHARVYTGPRGRDERIGGVLHALRNNAGPNWLDTFYLPR